MDAHRGLGCESELRVRSYVGFHLIYEGDGPRHASYETVSPSNLGRPHGKVQVNVHLKVDTPIASAKSHLRLEPVRRQIAVGLGVARFLRLTCRARGPDNARDG